MPRKFTATQAAADAIDCDLYRLMSRAEFMSENTKLHPSERRHWYEAYRAISAARSPVRAIMHPQTRDETVP